MKTVGILFSGGLDSTYLMWKNLKEGNFVKPFYVTIDNNINKTVLEKNRINLLIGEFKKEFPEQIIYYSNQDNYSNSINFGTNTYHDKLMYSQIPVWLLSTLFFQDSETSEIQIGYVCGDDMISYISDIKKIYNSYKSIIYGKMAKLTFPIIKIHKLQIIDELPKKYFDLTVTCEAPNIDKATKNDKIIRYTPCGNCDPCKKINGFLINSYNSDYKKAYSNVLVSELSRNREFLNEENRKSLEYTLNPLSLYECSPSKNLCYYQLELPFKEYSTGIINDFDINIKKT